MVMLAPTGLTNSNVTGTTFTGSWTAPTGTPAAGYNVLISSNGGVNDTYLGTAYTTSYNFTESAPGVALQPGTTYSWAIQAFGGSPTEYSDLARKDVTMTSTAPAPSTTAPVEVIRGGQRVVGQMKVVRTP